MLSLFFDNDGNVRANFARDRFRREVKVRRSWDVDLHATGSGLQIPIALRARIALYVDAAGCGMRRYVIRGILDFDLATGSIPFDSPTRMGNANNARDCFDANI